ncbi:hypothetical protein ACIQUB_13930 [Rhizobium sp. NPDC090275]|uniref:hypothetical protein n=1 Tax=Rhizobium sp. NPDC090275 TaxID=3364498 RepID=UPI0013AEF815
MTNFIRDPPFRQRVADWGLSSQCYFAESLTPGPPSIIAPAPRRDMLVEAKGSPGQHWAGVLPRIFVNLQNVTLTLRLGGVEATKSV